MKAIVFFANGFEEVEAITQVDFLRRGGIDTIAASIHDKKELKGAHGITFIADALLSDLRADEYDIVVLPGGYDGMMNLKASAQVAQILKDFNTKKKWIAAICASPSVLGYHGLVEGVKCTCYPGFEKEMTGGICLSDKVVVDGHIITSKGPGTSIDFALKIIELLQSKETAQKIASDAQYE